MRFSYLFLGALLLVGVLPLRSQNVAQGKLITSSAETWAGLPSANAVDGNVGTITHPLAGSGTLGFYYQVDLESEYSPHHISIVNRGDGCCPERLTNYKVTLYADGGSVPGEILWEATIRGDGSNSGIGGTDSIYATASTNPAHQFRGRFVRVTNLSGAGYNPQIAEIQVWLLGTNANLAAGRPVTSSGATYPGFPASKVTDTSRASPNFSHPADGPTTGYYYQTDLGADYTLNRVVLYNRTDCCPERLSNYRVTVYADGGDVPGVVRWEADIRTDGSNSGMGGADTILKTASSNPAHVFSGRFVRVTNLSGVPYNPQIAELEAYPEPPPSIRYFFTDAGNIGGVGLPSTATLSWSVENADAVSIDQGIGTVAASGSVLVTPASGTTYTLTATRAGAANVTASVTIAINAAVLPPRLTEFSANGGLLEDEEGDREDWIEIENPNPYTLNLAGLFLTDNPLIKAKWQFPLSNVPPGGRVIVFASAKDRTPLGGPLHSNFGLNADGEYLALVAPNGSTVIQQFPADYPATLTFPVQARNVSYGLDAASNLRYFKPATPGGVNGPGYSGVVADTNFSIKRGFFSNAQTVTITTATAGATIRYTTNNTEPTESAGTIYTAPIAITGTTVLRAAAFKTDHVPTNVDTNTYIFPADVVASPVMSPTITGHPTYGPELQNALRDVPSISITTPGSIGQNHETLCSFEYIPAGAPMIPGVQENAGVEVYGGEFTNFQKKNFRVSFRADFGATKLEIPTLFNNHARGWKPARRFDQLELRGGSHDMQQRGFYMSNIFTDGVMLDMGALNPHSRFVHLYLNGVYWGLFQLRERWGADMLTSYLGGPDSDHESINGNYNVGGWATPGDPYDGDGSSWTRIQSLRTNFAGVRPYLDVQHYVDYMLMFMFGDAEDEYRVTGPKDIGSGFKWFLNDADGYLRTSAGNSVSARSNPNPGRQRGDGPGSIFSQLWEGGDPDYRMLLADRIHKHLFNGGALTPVANQTRLAEMCAEINRAFYAESARWVSSGESRTPDTWASARDNILTNWFPTRTATYLSQLQAVGYYPSVAAPAFAGGTVSSGTVVNFPVAGATVYYTTDGSDPRLPGGALSPAAIDGSSVNIAQNTWLRARARVGSVWSAINEAFYTVTTPLTPGDVVLSEIHFHPQGDDATEFVELLNPTTHAINLRGARFVSGISYDFPNNRDVPLAPGGRLVLVASQYAFQKRYGLAVPVGGVYFDRLDNAGDRVALETAAATTLVDLTFDDIPPWPDSADGDGYSLVLANLDAPNSPASYRTSTAANGDPGASDSTTFGGDPLADADADGLVALVEHLFGTSDTIPTVQPLVVGRTGDGRVTITFPRRLSADDLSYAVEVSTDMSTWTPTASRSQHLNLGNGMATETWIANTADSQQFMRVRVVK